MARDRFITPAKGTHARQIILMLLRPQGLTAWEAIQAGLLRQSSSLSGIVSRLEYECGFDVRCIGSLPRTKVGRRQHIYRIVGRHRWNGRYRSFIADSDQVI